MVLLTSNFPIDFHLVPASCSRLLHLETERQRSTEAFRRPRRHGCSCFNMLRYGGHHPLHPYIWQLLHPGRFYRCFHIPYLTLLYHPNWNPTRLHCQAIFPSHRTCYRRSSAQNNYQRIVQGKHRLPITSRHMLWVLYRLCQVCVWVDEEDVPKDQGRKQEWSNCGLC